MIGTFIADLARNPILGIYMALLVARTLVFEYTRRHSTTSYT